MLGKINCRLILILLTVVSLFFSFITIAADPSNPHGFSGFVTDEDGDPYPDGTNISAKIGDRFYNTTVLNGAYGSVSGGDQFIVYGADDDSTYGTPIYFFVDGEQTSQMVAFQICPRRFHLPV